MCGLNCYCVVVDVVCWVMGFVVVQDGIYIMDYLLYVFIEEVGLLGSSNGGNVVFMVLGFYGEDILGVRWFVGWESFIGDQFVVVELNGNFFYELGICGFINCLILGLVQGFLWDPNGFIKLVVN